MNQGKSTGLASIINSIVSKFELAFDSSDLDIPKSDHYVLCLVDGLAYNSFLEHRSSTCFLSSFSTKQTLRSGFPSTTAACLTSLATGLDPIEHGIVGAAFKHNNLYFSPLRWSYIYPQNHSNDQLIEPNISIPTGAWDILKTHGINVSAYLPQEISNSTFTEKVFSAANIYGYNSTSDITSKLTDILKNEQKSFSYVYFGNLDLVGHIFGINSKEWKQEFLQIDLILQQIQKLLRGKATLLVTADHGMTHVDSKNMIDFSKIPDLYNQTQLMCGDIRARHIYLKPVCKDKISLTEWNKFLGRDFSIFTRQEIINTNFFGSSNSDEMHERIGDLILISKGSHGLIDSSSCYDQYQFSWKGHHGATSDEEQLIPLLIWKQ